MSLSCSVGRLHCDFSSLSELANGTCQISNIPGSRGCAKVILFQRIFSFPAVSRRVWLIVLLDVRNVNLNRFCS